MIFKLYHACVKIRKVTVYGKESTVFNNNTIIFKLSQRRRRIVNCKTFALVYIKSSKVTVERVLQYFNLLI